MFNFLKKDLDFQDFGIEILSGNNKDLVGLSFFIFFLEHI